MDISTIIGYAGVFASGPLAQYVYRAIVTHLRLRHQGSNAIELRKTAARIEQENKVIGMLMEQISELRDSVQHLEGRIESLEKERMNLTDKLSEARVENARLQTLLKEREDYIRELEADLAKCESKLSTLRPPAFPTP